MSEVEGARECRDDWSRWKETEGRKAGMNRGGDDDHDHDRGPDTSLVASRRSRTFLMLTDLPPSDVLPVYARVLLPARVSSVLIV